MKNKIFAHKVFLIWIVFTCSVAISACAADKTVSKNVTSDQALQMLLEGNVRYVSGISIHPRSDEARRVETAKNGQKPFCVVLSCSDSRVPVEVLFDQGVGDIFSIRVAGNVANTDEIASMEYGVGHLDAPVLIVLGHTQCGAVAAAATNAEVHGSIPNLLENIMPAVENAKRFHPELKGDDILPYAIEENVWQSIEDILKRSSEIRDKVKEGELKIVGAVYDINKGSVQWLGTYPNQARFLETPTFSNDLHKN